MMATLTEHAVKQVHLCNQRSLEHNGAPEALLTALSPWHMLPKQSWVLLLDAEGNALSNALSAAELRPLQVHRFA